MVQGRHPENALAAGGLEIHDLQHHRQRFGDKHAAHNEQHDFLARDDGHGAQRGAYGQCAHVAHEHLGRVGVEPKKAQPSPGQRGAEHRQLAGAGNIGKQQILGVHAVTHDVGKYSQRAADHDSGHDGKAVEAVGQVDRIGRTDDDKKAQRDEPEHTQRIGDIFEEGHDQVGLVRQVHLQAALHPLHEQFDQLGVRGRRHGESEIDRGGKADQRLPEKFRARRQALRVAVHHLAIVIDPADGAKTEGHHQHRPDKAIAKVGPQQRCDQHRDQHQRAAHGRRAGLGEVRFWTVIAHRLAYLVGGELADNQRTGQQRYRQRREAGEHRAQRDVVKHAERAVIL